MLRRLVHAIRMESWAKMRLDMAIPAILEAPDALAEFELSLTRSQMRAILEIVCGAGLGHMPLRRRQGEEIILWNNHHNPKVRYKFVANALNGALSHREGALPGFALISQDKDILHFQVQDRESLHFQQANDWLKILPNRMEIDGLPGKNAVVQFDVTGQGGFQAYFLLQDGRAIRRSGEHIQPTASMRAKSSDFLALVNGEASPYDLFAKGILQVDGDLDLMQAFYRGIEYLPQDRYEANDWRLEIDYLSIFRL